jgi:hypothetical protein
MSEASPSKEERILRVMKQVLTSVARDTATEPGMKHPLSEDTINDIRQCLLLISNREKELVEERGASMDMRPRFTDEPKPQGDVVVSIDSITRKKKD